MKSLLNHDKINQFSAIIHKAELILIVPHVNPDGDAIGACLALKGVLDNMGKASRVIVPNEFPEFLQWMKGSDVVIDYEKNEKEAAALFEKADTLFCLDFNDFGRGEGMKGYLKKFQGTRVLVDHHPNPSVNCSLVFSHPEISSTCELLFMIFEEAELKRFADKDVAEAIFTGMMTDTGNFSYNASNPGTYHIISCLLEMGIDKDKVHSNVYHTFSESRWRLVGHSLKEKMVILHQYRTGYISLSKKELDRFDFQPGDTEGLVNYPLMVKGIVFCALFLEKDDEIKVSLRSKGNFPANKFSEKHFEGGGHMNAAGGSSKLTLDETVAKFEGLLNEYKTDLLNSF
ncbi:MAG: bifunctional oligoribonuclease/PAP phosphatase NrnA [Prolixibacteraceae bacterium]|nr:bifunctional oligoribonuclease/PAP phosphatase NrnA [Prolixibacteraceae bacterium]